MMILNPATQMRIATITANIDPYLSKHCFICGKDFGVGKDVQVVSFIDHLILEHPLNIKLEDMQKDKEWLIKKFGVPPSSQG
jgi:hypothetical protein